MDDEENDHLEEIYPMATWGEQTSEDGTEECFFGAVDCSIKALFFFPKMSRQMMKIMDGISAAFFTDDYPRVPLAFLAIWTMINTINDTWFDPFLSSWSDGLRGGICGGSFQGRRRPLMFIGVILTAITSFVLVIPPERLSEFPSEGTGPGLHSFWRVIPIVETDGTTSPATWEGVGYSGPKRVQLYESGYLTDSTGGSTLVGSWNASQQRATPYIELEKPTEVLNVEIVLPNGSASGGWEGAWQVQCSNDALNWTEAWSFKDELPDKENEKEITKSFRYTSIAAGLWFGIFNLLYKTFGSSLFEVPREAYQNEITPHEPTRVSVFAWISFGELSGWLFGMVIAIAITFSGLDNCTSRTPYDGCDAFMPWAGISSGMFLFAGLCLVCRMRERGLKYLPESEATASLAETVISSLLNRPFRLMLVSEIAEAVGSAMKTGLMYQYFYTYVLEVELLQESFGFSRTILQVIQVLLENIIALPFVAVWAWAGNTYGVFNVFYCQNILMAVWHLMHITVFVFPWSPEVRFFIFVFWGIGRNCIWAAKPLENTLINQIIDYDEFLCGQRREAQLSMLKPFFEKFAELPAQVLPMVAINFFSHVQEGEAYNPELKQQPAGVLYTIAFTQGLIPGVLYALSAFLLRYFPMRTSHQYKSLMEGLELHRKGEAARDPFFQSGLVPARMIKDGGERVSFGGSSISSETSHTLGHFWPTELEHVLAEQDVSTLRTWPMRWCIISPILAIGSFVLFIFMIVDMVANGETLVNGLVSAASLVLFAVACALLWFNVMRLIQANEATKECISMDDVEVQLAMYSPFTQGAMVESDDDEYEDEYESDDEHS